MAGAQQSPGQSPEEDKKVKRKRPQQPSCDVCRLRKIRCDKKERLDRRAEELGTSFAQLSDYELEATACSMCLSQGLRCTFEHGSQKKAKRRNGKRILAIQSSQLQQQQQQQQQQQPPSSHLLSPTSALQQYQQSHPPSTCTCSCTCSSASTSSLHSSPHSFSEDNKKTPVTHSHSHSHHQNGLLGVEGMTRSLLEHCFKMFFRYIAPVRPILHTDKFWAAYLSYYDRNHQGEERQRESNGSVKDVAAADELLLLAVAGLGAGLLEPSIASLGSEAKFNLQVRCIERYRSVFETRDWTDWTQQSNASDVVEAMYLMTDFDEEVPQGRRDDGGIRNASSKAQDASLTNSYTQMTDLPEQRASSTTMKPRQDILRKNLFSHALLVEMALALHVNRAPKRRMDCLLNDPRPFVDGNGNFITAEELFRRKRIFWVLFTQDTLRCFARRESPKMGDDEYDQDLPKLSAMDGGLSKGGRQDPSSSAQSIKADQGSSNDPLQDFSIYQTSNTSNDPNGAANPSPANVSTQPARSVRFDGLYLEHNLRFVFLIRAVAIHFVSPRAQGKGIRTRDVENAVAAVQMWKEDLPSELHWDRNLKALAVQHRLKEGETRKFSPTNPIGLELARRNAIKALSLEYLYHGTILCLWSAVKDFGLRQGQDVTELASLLVFRMKSQNKAEPHTQANGNQTHGGSGAEETFQQEKERISERIDEMVKASFYCFTQVTREAQPHGLLRCSPNAFLKTIVAYLHLGLGMTSTPNAEMDANTLARAGECCHSLVDGLSSIDSYQTVEALRRQLQSKLSHLPPPRQPISQGNEMIAPQITITDTLATPVPVTNNDDLPLPSSHTRQSSNSQSNSWLSDWLAQELFQPMSDALLPPQPDDGVYRQQQSMQWQQGATMPSMAPLADEREMAGLFDPVW